MNLIILLAIIAISVASPWGFVGVVTGLIFCYIFMDGRGDKSSIKYHLTHWSWWDMKV